MILWDTNLLLDFSGHLCFLTLETTTYPKDENHHDIDHEAPMDMTQPLAGRAVYAGSFDPITYGHIDLIKRASRLFGELVIGVGENPRKQYLFDIQTREQMVLEQIQKMSNVRVQRFQNLLIDFARSVGANVILRGLRASTDFDYEFQIGLVNMNMNREIETLFLLADPKNIFISSSTVKEIAYFGGNLDSYVPPEVAQRLREKFSTPQKDVSLSLS